MANVFYNLTDAQAQAVTGGNAGDLYYASDTAFKYKIGDTGLPSLEEDLELVYVLPNGDSPEQSTSETVKSVAGQWTTLDHSTSKSNGVESGSVVGLHFTQFNRVKNMLDKHTAGVSATTVVGTNVTETTEGGSKFYTKNVSGNVWNAYMRSTDGFDADIEDGMVSFAIEADAGTIREMAGLAKNPTANASYSSIDYAIYQVNDDFYSYVYESGAGTKTGVANFDVNTGDRFYIACERGVVTYGVIRDGTNELFPIYQSAKPASGQYYFKAALNRGTGSSGHSKVGDVKWHKATTPEPYSVNITGSASAPISETHKDNLATVGIVVSDTATYDMLSIVQDGDYRCTGEPVTYAHSYTVPASQSSGTI